MKGKTVYYRQTPCPKCKSRWRRIEKVPEHLPHSGKEVCSQCGRYIKWLGPAGVAAAKRDAGEAKQGKVNGRGKPKGNGCAECGMLRATIADLERQLEDAMRENGRLSDRLTAFGDRSETHGAS